MPRAGSGLARPVGQKLRAIVVMTATISASSMILGATPKEPKSGSWLVSGFFKPIIKFLSGPECVLANTFAIRSKKDIARVYC